MVTKENMIMASKLLSRLNLNFETNGFEFTTFWCRVAFDCCEQWNYKEHSHSSYEIHFALTGQCEFHIDGKKVLLTEKNFLFIPPKINHTILHVSPDFSKFVWCFNINTSYNNLMKAIKGINEPLMKPACDELIHFVHIMLDNAYKKKFDYYGVIKTQLYCFFIYMIQTIIKLNNEDRHKEYIRKDDNRAEPIIKFIRDNLSSRLTANDIAMQFHISKKQLSRITMSACNMSIGVLKRSIQIEYIRYLLTDTSLTLEEIAHKAGFTDRYTMSKAFKRAEGMAPGKYRSSTKE